MRIFVTVGAQMPFDRLIAAVDAWAAEHPEHEVQAQIGETALTPRHLSWTKFLPPPEFDRAFEEADAIVGHAGTGTLFAAMERGKPVLVLPRHAALRETRNEHQVATAKRFAHFAGVVVAWDETELPAKLDALPSMRGGSVLAHAASGPLVEAIATFIDQE
jgi:UDP-N-acetylglucosamine transferase subunit ALG13